MNYTYISILLFGYTKHVYIYIYVNTYMETGLMNQGSLCDLLKLQFRQQK